MIARTLVAIAACGLLISTADAQPKAQQRAKTSEKVSVGGWELPMTYYAVFNRQAPVVLLLQSNKGRQQIWEKLLVDELWKNQGMAVITVDLRRQGKATWVSGGKVPPAKFDLYGMITRDLEAIKTFIYGEHQKKALNMRKMAIVACGEIANVALAYTLIDWAKKPFNDAPTLAGKTPRGQDIQALVLVSPSGSKKIVGLPGAGNLKKMSQQLAHLPVSVLVVYGTNHRDSWRGSQDIYLTLRKEAKKPPIERHFVRPYTSKQTGQDLMREQMTKLAGPMKVLFTKKLKEFNAPWRDRKSKLFD